ncbi:hypothetical protein GGI12_001619 [Dipsacomyces acuminosporus]|nr:hypothetical protein GGI12_001619 [Dipsacomyces acuminosporus]
MEVQRLVDAYIIGLGDNSDNTELLAALVSRISGGDISLLELVQALGSYLGSDEATRRSRGTHVLSDVLGDLPEDAIPARATEMLVQFFCARLADAICVPQILTAVLALLRLSSFSDQHAVYIATALFKEVHLQSFQHSTRSAAYRVLDLILQSHPEAVRRIGDDFVLGFAQMLDGEKDPRSLMVAFNIIPRIVELVDIKRHAEDLFDVIFCYFPITFKHRDGDPSSISPESLKKALRACVTCSPYFGEMAVTPLVNKLTSSITSVKIDSLETLTAGARTFDPAAFKPEINTLVDQIREEVVMAADEAVVAAALETLEAVYAAVSQAAPASTKNSDGGSEDVDMADDSTPLDYVLKEAMLQLTADEIKNPEEIGKILRAVARSSAYNCSVVSDAVIPIVVERLSSTDVLTVRRELMDVLNYVLSASCDIHRKAECLDSSKTDLLNVYRPETAVPLDKEYSFLHVVRLKGITLLILIPELLTENEIAVALQTIGAATIERNEDENVNKEATHLLVQLSQANSDQVIATALPMFFDALRADVVAASKVSRLLNALGAISVAASKMFLPVLEGLAQLVLADGLVSSHHPAAMATIRKAIEATVLTKDADVAAVSSQLVAAIVEPVARWAYASASAGASVQPAVVAEISRCIVSLFSRLDVESQERYVSSLFSSYYSVIVEVEGPTANLKQLLPLFSAAICSCLPDARLPVQDPTAFVAELARVALVDSNKTHRDACLEIIASMINKTKDSKARALLVQAALSSPGSGSSLILLHQWVARALVSCNDKQGYDSVRWLFDQITQASEFAAQAAKGFEIVLGDHGWSVSKATHGVFKLLFKQRFYATVLPEITSKFKSSQSDDVKANLLVVLTSVVKHMPKSVLMNGIEDVIPLLLSAIRLTQGDLKAASIKTVTMVILETPDTLKGELVSSVIPLLLASIRRVNRANLVDVRRAAIDALSLIPEKYAYPVVHTARAQILSTLAKARDDHKRLVRQDAVKAYNKWLNFGEI